MQDFAAIDFETANGRRSSVCSIGVVIVCGGEIVDRFYSLIQPSPNYYTYWTTEVHGLTRQDADNQSIFLEVWAQIKDKIAGLPLVVHNRPFDESCLKAAFEEYGLEYPNYEFHCTLAGVLIFPVTNFILWSQLAVTIWRIITMFSLMRKRAQG